MLGPALFGALCLVGVSCKHEKSSAPCPPCPAPGICNDGICKSPALSLTAGTPILTAALGSAPGQFQVFDAEEGAALAPRSLALGPDGNSVYVLDQVNARVQLFGAGRAKSSFSVSETAADLTRLDSGELVVLDPKEDAFVVLDASGNEQGRSPVKGAYIEEPFLVEALFTRPDGVWAQVDRFSVWVLDAKGEAPPARRMLPGLPSRNGTQLLSVSRLNDGSLHVVTRPTAGLAQYTERHLTFETPVSTVIGFDTDKAGNVYLLTRRSATEVKPGKTELTVLSPTLADLRTTEVMGNDTAREVSRPFRVADDGVVLHLHVTTDGVAVRRY